jgi:hypothetical protein
VTTPDYKALCAELVEALENARRIIHREDGTLHINTAEFVLRRARAALAAEPVPVGVFTPTVRRNPYRHFLRDVHVRRIYMLTVLPVCIVLSFPLMALESCTETVKEIISIVIPAIKDGNSYD